MMRQGGKQVVYNSYPFDELLLEEAGAPLSAIAVRIKNVNNGVYLRLIKFPPNSEENIDRLPLSFYCCGRTALQIDGNFGFNSGVAEMLAQSHDGAIHLLPVLPQAWPKGEVTGLVMRGGFVVDMKWDKSELTYLKVVSRLGGNFRLRSYFPLPKPVNFQVKKASGDNSNPFYSVSKIKTPLKHTEKKLPRISLESVYLLDVTTEQSGEYVWRREGV